MNAKLGKFPPFPPQAQWGFRACPALARFTCLDYSCKALAQKKDPSFADRLPAEWKAKYQGWWPATPYLEIPESVRLAAEPELDPAKLQEIMAKELVPNEPIHQEAFEVFQSCIAIGELPVYEDMTGAYALIKIPRGLAPHNLLACSEAYMRIYHVPEALSVRPQGAGSYDRQFQKDLNALSAYILLQYLSPAEATAITAEAEVIEPGRKKGQRRKVKRGLFSGEAEWRSAKEGGEFLVKKTLKGQLTEVLLWERFGET